MKGPDLCRSPSRSNARRVRGACGLLACALVLSLAACATVGALKSEPLSAGTSRTFTAAFDRVLTVVREAVVQVGLEIDEEAEIKDGTWMLVGRHDMSAFTWGEPVRVVVERTSPTETAVRVTQRRLQTPGKGDWSAPILVTVELKLK